MHLTSKKKTRKNPQSWLRAESILISLILNLIFTWNEMLHDMKQIGLGIYDEGFFIHWDRHWLQIVMITSDNSRLYLWTLDCYYKQTYDGIALYEMKLNCDGEWTSVMYLVFNGSVAFKIWSWLSDLNSTLPIRPYTFNKPCICVGVRVRLSTSLFCEWYLWSLPPATVVAER